MKLQNIIILITISLILLAFAPQDKKTTPPWDIPAEYLKLKTPKPLIMPA